MIVTIRAKPVFYFELTLAHIEVLWKLSREHYDHKCKDASNIGGFIHGWHNAVTYSDDGTKAICQADWRQMDLTLKILECIAGRNMEEIALMADIRLSFNKAMTESIAVVSCIHHDVK